MNAERARRAAKNRGDGSSHNGRKGPAALSTVAMGRLARLLVASKSAGVSVVVDRFAAKHSRFSKRLVSVPHRHVARCVCCVCRVSRVDACACTR